MIGDLTYFNRMKNHDTFTKIVSKRELAEIGKRSTSPLPPPRSPPSFPSCLSVRSKAGGSLWLTFHDNMPLEIAVLLINPLDMTDLPQGLAL